MDDVKYFELGKIGEASWDILIKKTIDWDRDNKIKILGDFKVSYIHWTQIDGRWKMQECVDGCKLCEQKVRRTPRYNVIALDKTDDVVKNVEIGAQLFKQISTFMKNDPDAKDFVIRKGRAHDNIPIYRVRIDYSESISTTHIEDPVNDLVLDSDICPEHNVRGIIRDNKCVCPTCFYVIWGS